jgi:acyl-coenzyme A synthetase/AMP-(fatty) acid ligase
VFVYCSPHPALEFPRQPLTEFVLTGAAARGSRVALSCDRVKELIKYKGLQVPPAELEAVLLSHPAVADAAVVPLADPECGEIPRAFVVLKGMATAEELMAHVAGRVAHYKKVRRVDFIDAIPKSPSGKILRRLLRGRPA